MPIASEVTGYRVKVISDIDAECDDVEVAVHRHNDRHDTITICTGNGHIEIAAEAWDDVRESINRLMCIED